MPKAGHKMEQVKCKIRIKRMGAERKMKKKVLCSKVERKKVMNSLKWIFSALV
jgi:hypothetical protein